MRALRSSAARMNCGSTCRCLPALLRFWAVLRCGVCALTRWQASCSIVHSLFPDPASKHAFEYLASAFHQHQSRVDESSLEAPLSTCSPSQSQSTPQAYLASCLSYLRESSLSAARVHAVCRCDYNPLCIEIVMSILPSTPRHNSCCVQGTRSATCQLCGVRARLVPAFTVVYAPRGVTQTQVPLPRRLAPQRWSHAVTALKADTIAAVATVTLV